MASSKSSTVVLETPPSPVSSPMDTHTRELSVVRGQVMRALAVAESIIVGSDEQMLEAGEIRKKIKQVGKIIKEKKEEITKPLNEALKNVRAMFAPLEQNCEEAEMRVSQKMLIYQSKVDAERRKIEAEAQRKMEEAQRKLEEGKISEKQAQAVEARAEKKLESAPEAIKKSEDFHTRTVKKFRILDANAIPRSYLVPDEVAIRKAMMAGVAVAGVEFYGDKILV